MKNKIFASAIYIVSFVLITLLAGGIFTIINKCEYYENRLSGILILLPIIGFLFSRIVKLPQLGIIFWLILPAFSLIFEYHSTQNMIEKRLDSKINKKG